MQGSITFIAGEVAKTGDMKVGTPTATMGIRGTAVQVDIDVNNGQTKMSVLVEPNGVTGSFNVYSLSGALIGTVNNANVVAVRAAAQPSGQHRPVKRDEPQPSVRNVSSAVRSL